MSVPRDRDRSRRRVLLGAVLTGVLALVPLSGTYAAFTGTTENAGSTVTAQADWKPPLVTGPLVQRAGGSHPGFVKQGIGYTAYARVVDDTASGGTPAGVASARANVASIDGAAGGTAAAMAATSTTIGGVTYNYSVTRTTTATLAPNAAASVSASGTDAATPVANTGTGTSTVVVENTPPLRTTLGIVNGGTAQQVGQGDQLTFTWDEVVEPYSVIAGWTGAPSIAAAATYNVTVQIVDAGGVETLTVRNEANTAALPLGQVVVTPLNTINTGTATFGGPGTPVRSTIVWTGTAFRVTLGTAAGATVRNTQRGQYTWTPSATLLDRAGNPASATALNEGNNDRDF